MRREWHIECAECDYDEVKTTRPKIPPWHLPRFNAWQGYDAPKRCYGELRITTRQVTKWEPESLSHTQSKGER